MDKKNIKILVTYASKHGSTKEIAEKIGDIIQQAEFHTEVLSVNKVNNLAQYNAVILGSAVYIGQWRKEAVNFIKNNEEVLKNMPVWFFSSGPTGKGDPVKLTKGWQFPKNIQSIADNIKPQSIKLFHGNIDIKKLNFIHKFMVKKVEAPVGDFRDWDDIVLWGNSIVKHLMK